MKAIISIFLILSFSQNSFGQTVIDKISSTEDIKILINKIDRSLYGGIKLKEEMEFTDQFSQNISNSLCTPSWIKADFDGNGLADIAIVGIRHFPLALCILDKGNQNYEVNRLTKKKIYDGIYIKLKTENKKNKIELFYVRDPTRNKYIPKKLQKKTLVFCFGDFVEENKSPVNHKIEKIEFISGGACRRRICPTFETTIDSNKSAVLNKKSYNRFDKTQSVETYNTTIPSKKFNQLISLLNYLDFENLNERYTTTWTHAQGCSLKITYNDGKIKSIKDYHANGTNGLSLLYEHLFDLRENQNWNK